MDYQLEQEIEQEHEDQPKYRYEHEYEHQHEPRQENQPEHEPERAIEYQPEYIPEDEYKFDAENELDLEPVLGTDPQHDHGSEHEYEPELEHEPSQALVPQPQTEGLHKDRFEFNKVLGSGFMGKVYLARDRRSRFICALKRIKKSKIRENRMEHQIGREIDIQNNIRHPNILRLLGHFHDDKFVTLVLEYAGNGELFKLLEKKERFDEETAAMYVAQVASTLQYLHRKKVMHRDIKLENILIGNYGELKLADFGWSVHEPQNWRQTFCGTWDYLPPEMLLRDENVNEGGYDEKVDVWALGILAYEFLVGMPPFPDSEPGDSRAEIASRKLIFPYYVTDPAKDLIEKLLQRNPKDRLRLEAMENHPWIRHFCVIGRSRPKIQDATTE